MTNCESKDCSTACGCASLKKQQLTPPPSSGDMIRMVISLTAVAMASALILGGIYIFTEPVRLKNLSEREAKTIQVLLELPSSAKIEEVRRYQGSDLSVLYLTDKFLIHFSPEGKELRRIPSQVKNADEADTWVKSQVPALDSQMVGRFFVGKDGEKIAGYVIAGETQGYKAPIHFFTALSSDFRIKGVEVIQQEDDPGLGAEIVQKYFKNQFAGRSSDELASLSVSKDPLSDEWKRALEELGPTPFSLWYDKQQGELKSHPVVHAITGATISSEALTNGVKRAVTNFKKRLELIKGAL